MTRWTLILTLLLAPIVAFAQEEGQETKKPAAEKKNPIVIIETNHGTIEAELFADAAPKTVANFIGLAEGTKEWNDLKLGEKVKRPFYDGLVFHRVIADFMIQGGCPNGNGTGGPGYKFEDEFNFEKLGLNDELVIDAEGKPSEYLGADQQFAARYAAEKLGITTQEQYKTRFQEVLDVLKKTKIVDLLKAKGVKDNTELKTSYRPMRGYLAMANSGPNTNGSQFFINLIDTLWLSGRHTVFGKVVSGMDIVDKIGAVPVAKPGDKPLEDVVIKSIRVKKVEEKTEVTSEQPKDEATPEEK